MKKEKVTLPAPRFTRAQWQIVMDHWEDLTPALGYEQQLEKESKIAQALKVQGFGVEEIAIDAAKMLSWLKRQRRKNDGLGRGAYLAEAARCRHLNLPEPE